jgi:streptomycin 6-kinase
LKVIKHPGEEWPSGEVLQAFGAKGTVGVYDQCEGALLLEPLFPGNPLSELVLAGCDDEATEILAELVKEMSPAEPPRACSSVEVWGEAFERYRQSGDQQIPADLVERGHAVYIRLCESQRTRRLLHGDLHHDNILFDTERGWIAIDPKGVVGELEYDLGAALRNPAARPDLFASADIAHRRLERFRRTLSVNADRVLEWSFAQAILAAIWKWEDGVFLRPDDGFLKFAASLL